MDYRVIPNLATMFFEKVDTLADHSFLRNKVNGSWKGRSYGDIGEQVERLARGLRALGIERGDRVMIVSENRPEWVITDLAVCAIGGITVPAYTTNTVDDHRHILDHSGSRIVVVSGERLARNVLPAIAMDGSCDIVIMMEGPAPKITDGVRGLQWDEVLTLGATRDGRHQGAVSVACP